MTAIQARRRFKAAATIRSRAMARYPLKLAARSLKHNKEMRMAAVHEAELRCELIGATTAARMAAAEGRRCDCRDR